MEDILEEYVYTPYRYNVIQMVDPDAERLKKVMDIPLASQRTLIQLKVKRFTMERALEGETDPLRIQYLTEMIDSISSKIYSMLLYG